MLQALKRLFGRRSGDDERYLEEEQARLQATRDLHAQVNRTSDREKGNQAYNGRPPTPFV